MSDLTSKSLSLHKINYGVAEAMSNPTSNIKQKQTIIRTLLFFCLFHVIILTSQIYVCIVDRIYNIQKYIFS